MRPVIGLLAVATIGFLWILTFKWGVEGGHLHMYGFDQSPPKSTDPSGLWITIWTLFGIISRVVFDTLRQRSVHGMGPKALFARVFSDYRTWGALAFSPLVILMFYDALSHMSSPNLSALVSYQNGFFVKALFDIR